jgi:hypothetical protein
MTYLKNKLEILKSEHKTLLKQIAEGNYIRSRAKMIEEGDRPSSFFLNLEKNDRPIMLY